MNLEGSNVNTLGVSLVEPVPNPHFSKIEDIRFGSKSLSCMIEPVLGFNDEVMFAIQMEAKQNKKAN